ncbi:MAG: DNA primase [Anaerolineae bacterium]|nr:DNA primase [Anaerolineae bacterium]
MSVVDEIKERLDIVEVVSRYVPLKKAGRNYKGLCPFHSEKTPSFVVFPDTGTWHCFGACGTGGDLFSFIMKRENVDFGEALRMLAPMAGVSLERPTVASSVEEQRRQRLLEITAAAAAYYHRLLLGNEGERARAYLAQRQISSETIERFQLGYAPDAWEALQHHLRGQGYAPADLEAAGLIIPRSDGTYYDRFRDRLMIPIHDLRGRPIAFGARLLPGGREADERAQPKYINSPQTLLFDKSRELFGLHAARQAIRAAGAAVIVEGYMDVLSAHQHGFANVVATMGTALTEQQLRRLKRDTSRFILALDADVAGQAATLRGVQQAREALDRTWVPTPTAGGLIRFEERLEAQLRIMTLPPGQDPDQVIRADPQRWAQLVDEAQPVVDYFMRLVTDELDLSTAWGKAEAVDRLTPLIREVADDIERAHYIQKLARQVQVDEQIVQSQVLRPRRRQERPGPPLPAEEEAVPREAGVFRRLEAEAHCLAQLLQWPELLPELDVRLQALQVRPLSSADFSQVVDQEVFDALLQAQVTDQAWDAEAFQEGLEAPVQERWRQLLSYGSALPSLPEAQAADDLVNVVLRLRLGRLRRRLAELRYLLEEAQGEGDGQAVAEYGKTVQEYTAEMGRLQQVLNERTWSGRRRAL